jgi:predicted nucleic acid-binding protein
VIYLDSSVALAHLLIENRAPPEALWRESLVASRLLEYEIWNRLHERRLDPLHAEDARALIDRVALIELTPVVLRRALKPFPTPVRTLDALHLASLESLRESGQSVELATYDRRMAGAARALGIPLAPL